jgi:hypothetical protein
MPRRYGIALRRLMQTLGIRPDNELPSEAESDVAVRRVFRRLEFTSARINSVRGQVPTT